MPKAHDLCHGHIRLRLLIELALREGWDVRQTAGGLKFVKPGFPPIFTRSTANDPALAPPCIDTPGDRNG
ncbi:MAG: hypothetical protein LBU46_06085 [Candidatus Accumulibacter sp.]|jgi:hypothetical protein|nr:hypothetical protein [Accumulibacter sp.]